MGQRWRVAVSTLVFADRPLFEALDNLHLLGAAAVEVTANEAHLDPRLDLPDLEEIGAALDRLGLSLFSMHAPFRGLDLAAPREEERRAAVATIRRALEVAAALDCRHVVVHPSAGTTYTDPGERAAAWRRTVASLTELGRRAGELGVTVMIENLPDTHGSLIGGRVADLAALIAEVGSPQLGICLDVSHAMISTGGWEGELLAALPYLRSMHASDGDGSADAHLPLGDGTVAWDRMFQLLDQHGYGGGFVLEVLGGDDGVRRSLAAVERWRSG
ncbi:MAG TPA: sugar phosphate isomerase/epimerase family protein [Limnochordales bacterium]